MKNIQVFLSISIDEAVKTSFCITKWALEQIQTSGPSLEQDSVPNAEHNLKHAWVEVVNKHYNYTTHPMLLRSLLEQLNERTNRIYIICFFRHKLVKDLGRINDNVLYKCHINVESKLSESYIIDYSWNKMLWRDCHIALERECAAAWLSTLGGGFSALGDYSLKFAKMALLTSLQQLRLANISKDENGIARGLLFLSLAFSQLGFHKRANKLLDKARNYPSFDPRHQKMCMGVQVKLNYEANIRKELPKEEKKRWALQRLNRWNTIMNDIKSHFKLL